MTTTRTAPPMPRSLHPPAPANPNSPAPCCGCWRSVTSWPAAGRTTSATRTRRTSEALPPRLHHSVPRCYEESDVTVESCVDCEVTQAYVEIMMNTTTTDKLSNGTRVTMSDGTGEATIKFEYRDEQGRPRYTVYQGRRRDHGFVAGLHFTVAV